MRLLCTGTTGKHDSHRCTQSVFCEGWMKGGREGSREGGRWGGGEGCVLTLSQWITNMRIREHFLPLVLFALVPGSLCLSKLLAPLAVPSSHSFQGYINEQQQRACQ
mmetsp:Transcript_27584/g.89839  ORF Transcript_27584/g.89839 Transcript_27584/m.89839 type:complete len:107 (+) Transcript_27584:631-951(+)